MTYDSTPTWKLPKVFQSSIMYDANTLSLARFSAVYQQKTKVERPPDESVGGTTCACSSNQQATGKDWQLADITITESCAEQLTRLLHWQNQLCNHMGWAINPCSRPPPMPSMPRSFPRSQLSVFHMRPGSKQISLVAFDFEQAPEQSVNLILGLQKQGTHPTAVFSSSA